MALPFSLLLALLATQAPDASASAAPRAGLVDRVVAIIDKRPMLLSELEFEARVEAIQHGGLEAATAPLSDEVLAAALDLAIGRRLALAEADRLQVFETGDAVAAQAADKAAAKALQAFKKLFKSDKQLLAFLDGQEASPEELAALLQRNERVTHFIDTKVRFRARLTDEDARRYWAAHASELGAAPFEDLRGAILEKLTRERYQVLTRKVLDELRAKADVRVVAPFAQQGFDAGGPPSVP